MKRTSLSIEKQIVEYYNNNHVGVKTIGSIFNLNSITVYNILKRYNVSIRSKGGYPKDYFNSEAIISDYKHGVRVTEIAEKYNVPIETIYFKLKQLGIPRDQIYFNCNLRRDYFRNIDSYDKAYFLGLMITDGSVLENNSISITLKSADDYILEIFRNKINNENPLYKLIRREGSKESCFHFKSYEVQQDLKKYGVVFRKTPITFFPYLINNPHMMSHLVRGLIDGDGWISAISHNLGICSASYNFIYWFRKFITDILPVAMPKIIVQIKNRNIPLYTIAWASKKDIFLIGRYIYIGKNDCYLKRKYKNWLNIIIHDNTEVN